MKIKDETGASGKLECFVEDELIAMHHTSMFCMQVQPRNPHHFTLLFVHEKGAPRREELQELFVPFGKCNVRTKDNKMTYINFARFEQVVCVLEALKSAKLFLRDMVVLIEELVPVQNAKLMLSFLDAPVRSFRLHREASASPSII